MAFKALTISLLCLLAVSGLAGAVLCRDDAYNPYGGGIVHGQVLGFNWFNELIPVVWAEVSAWRDGELVAKAYSMAGGHYEIILPVGWYTLVVEEPGYKTVSREIFVSSGSSTAINFVLELSMEPIHKPKPKPPTQYRVEVGVSGLPEKVKAKLYVDGAVETELGTGETCKLSFENGTQHKLSVTEMLEGNGERYIADQPSITVSAEKIHVFNYRAEYFLRFTTEPEGLSLPSTPRTGWYPAGEAVTTPTAPILLEESPVVRYRFKAWTLDGKELEGNPAEFTMNSPHLLKAVYSKEFLVEVSSPIGEAEGSGWYPAGSTATITVQPSLGFWVKQVFTGWTGDYVGRNPTATITVNKPMRIVATWTVDYTPITLICIAAAAAILTSTVLILKRRRGSTPPPERTG